MRRPRVFGMVVVAVLTAMVSAACGSSRHPTSATTPPAATTGPGDAASAGTSGPAPVAGASGVWAGYHADLARTGAISSNVEPTRVSWTANLGAAVYGQPVAGDGRIYAATERNRGVALDPATGTVIWSVSLGTPLTNVDSVAGCGDIDPLGITSTPALDVARGVLYVVAEVSDGHGSVHHQLTGLNATTGAIVLSDNVDPPLPAGERGATLLQRAGLALANGRVYVSYGGNAGDCGHYHGWVVGVEQTGTARKVSFEVAADGEGGAIWEAGGAPAIDTSGDLYVSTGNANPDPPQGGPDPKQYTESVVKLSPTLVPLASFKDRIAGGDEDLATANPVLLPGAQVFAIGKTDVGYLLRQNDLHQIAAISGLCGSDPDGGSAYDAAGNRIFIPCHDGSIQVVDLTTRRAGARLAGANGAPILIGAHLWAAQYPTGHLSEFVAATGRKIRVLNAGPVPTFASPSVGPGQLLIGTRTGVTAFS